MVVVVVMVVVVRTESGSFNELNNQNSVVDNNEKCEAENNHNGVADNLY
jgi:hypothetical protein